MMFGMDKSINTKVDAEAVFVKALDAAISQATSAQVSSRTIIGHLETRAQQQRPQWRHPSQSSKMFDGHGNPIDLNRKVQEARVARQRRIDEASVIPVGRRESAASGYRVR
jgi:hypothetical protein